MSTRPLGTKDRSARMAETSDFLERVEFLRLDAGRKLEPTCRAALGQFLTPAAIARLMASMLTDQQQEVRLLDPGAGVGSLFAAAVVDLCRRQVRPATIHVSAYEIDPTLAQYIPDVFHLCQAECRRAGVRFTAELVQADFLESAAEMLTGTFFEASTSACFTCAILNPPYRKIHSASAARTLLRRLGVQTSNLYTGFMATAVKLLVPGGELVAITPRSFCNGTYFRPFRRLFLRDMALRRLHVFESRQKAFSDDDVLQENLILHAVKGGGDAGNVLVSSSDGPADGMPLTRSREYDQIVRPDDPECFIHITPDDLADQMAKRMAAFPSTLSDLGLAVSTGRVVDFRAREFLRSEPDGNTVPLIWPAHFAEGYIAWPKVGRKPNAIADAERVRAQLVPSEPYVLVRRFSAKEERRRVVAAVYDPARLPCERVGFENHLNYFHRKGRGLGLCLARGLAGYLNSTLVDAYFRQFNGHTQVNATDLRSLHYPTLEQLHALGRRIGPAFPRQAELDDLVEEELLPVVATPKKVDPVRVKRRLDEALEVLKVVGLPRGQQNERSALTLLGLLDLKPAVPWTKASAPLRGIRQLMDFFAEQYGKGYAENSRETVRRQTVHQFLEAGLIVVNPDDPHRPTNSGKTVYQIEAGALELLRTFGTKAWEKNVRAYLTSIETLAKRYARERKLRRIPLKLPSGQRITLSPGGQNVLVEKVITLFAEHFTPGGVPLYVGDTGEKFAYFDREALAQLGVEIEAHGKMPDVVIHDTEHDWLVLVEAVTSHGPVNPKRREELKRLFGRSRAGLVFVTAFLDRRTMVQYLGDISWETEVWVAESPTHLIHFNGERFLGPYPE
ncbi:MAG TPA: BsuBI/PstI family type II restriction endonuclease [Gemmataceae bacterium]|nr:BsuBI/PstI family type II restriction endonuclease [Gemmataceae bacterium]